MKDLYDLNREGMPPQDDFGYTLLGYFLGIVGCVGVVLFCLYLAFFG